MVKYLAMPLQKLRTINYRSAALATALIAIGALNGCNSEPSVTRFPVPEAIRQVRAINANAVSLEISINNGRPQIFRGQGINDSWAVPLNVPASSTNTISVTWVETFEQERLLMASQTSTFTTDTQASTITLSDEYTTTGIGFDFDSDGVSNLVERIGDSNPLVADSGTFIINEPQTVSVNAGCFLMGSPDTELLRNLSEIPHQVCINAFAIGKYEVTFEQYDQFAVATGRARPNDNGWGRGAQPAMFVSQADAVAYTEWLSEQTDKNYRLPTEAEWEYAARAGTDTPFSTGQTITEAQANFNASVTYNGSPVGLKSTQTAPVGSYTANPWGIHDMNGNLAEWTCSTFSIIYSGAEQSCDPFPENPTYSIRGGSWSAPPERLRSAYRARETRDRAYSYSGFRIALEY